MEIDFDRLIQLQNLDSEIKHDTLFIENIPRLIEEIDRKIAAGSLAVAEAREKLAQNQKRRRDLEGNVKDIKVQVSKFKRQLGEVKTNKEYAIFLKEIEESQHKVDTLEEEIISEMLAADDIEETIKAAVFKQTQEHAEIQKDQEILRRKKQDMETRRDTLIRERDALLPEIPADQMKLYLSIFNKKNGTALSAVKGEFCSLCHVRIRPQMLNEIRDRSKIYLCENCGRILYWVNKPEAAVETKPENAAE
ncbi:MAG: zinc ribbon domain-containing protein [Candidatus Aminicenantales bacterium]